VSLVGLLCFKHTFLLVTHLLLLLNNTDRGLEKTIVFKRSCREILGDALHRYFAVDLWIPVDDITTFTSGMICLNCDLFLLELINRPLIKTRKITQPMIQLVKR
jgi:hypothetical protein